VSSGPTLRGCLYYFLAEEILKTFRGASLTAVEHDPSVSPWGTSRGANDLA
jgi:hypothetical protein